MCVFVYGCVCARVYEGTGSNQSPSSCRGPESFPGDCHLRFPALAHAKGWGPFGARWGTRRRGRRG